MNYSQHFTSFRQHIIGIDSTFPSPFGEKKIVYFDWTASGRLYRPIEDKILNEFGPYVANTHTESNFCGSLSTEIYHTSLESIKKQVGADQHDVIITESFGMTGVINKFQRLLGLRLPEKWSSHVFIEEDDRPVVFVTHMEHHSNQTSWLETIAEVVVIQPHEETVVDFDHFDSLLKEYRHRKMKIGAFTACSNVTGIQTPYHQLAKMIHEHQGFCIVDFAASAPYVKINMHPEDPMEKLDAIVFSPHKFLGGPGTSGVLVFDSGLYSNKTPDHPGGGTVLWTNPWGGKQYFSDIELRENGGTPGFIQAYKTALCFRLKEKMNVEHILSFEKKLLTLLLNGLHSVEGLTILDKHFDKRIGIVSFYIENIHYHLLVRLLSDRYGIQVRGGCSCAGTYGHFLLHINQEHSKNITDQINKGDLSAKPGWVRLSIHPTTTEEDIFYVIQALKEIVSNLDDFQKDYRYDEKKNDYVHWDFVPEQKNWFDF